MDSLSETTTPSTADLLDVRIFKNNLSEAEKAFNLQAVSQQQFCVPPDDRKIGILFNEKKEIIGITKSDGHTVKISATNNTLNHTTISLEDALITATSIEQLAILGQHTPALLLRTEMGIDNQWRSKAYVQTADAGVALSVNHDLEYRLHVKDEIPFFENLPTAVSLDTPLNTQAHENAQVKKRFEDQLRMAQTQEKIIQIEEIPSNTANGPSNNAAPTSNSTNSVPYTQEHQEAIHTLKQWLHNNRISHPISPNKIAEFKTLWEPVSSYSYHTQNNTTLEQQFIADINAIDNAIDTESTDSELSAYKGGPKGGPIEKQIEDRFFTWIKALTENKPAIEMQDSGSALREDSTLEDSTLEDSTLDDPNKMIQEDDDTQSRHSSSSQEITYEQDIPISAPDSAGSTHAHSAISTSRKSIAYNNGHAPQTSTDDTRSEYSNAFATARSAISTSGRGAQSVAISSKQKGTRSAISATSMYKTQLPNLSILKAGFKKPPTRKPPPKKA